MCVYAPLHLLRIAKQRVLSEKFIFCDYTGYWPASNAEKSVLPGADGEAPTDLSGNRGRFTALL